MTCQKRAKSVQKRGWVGYTFSLKTLSMLLMKQVLQVMEWCALATFCGTFAAHLAR
jgi:hypothetical protein